MKLEEETEGRGRDLGPVSGGLEGGLRRGRDKFPPLTHWSDGGSEKLWKGLDLGTVVSAETWELGRERGGGNPLSDGQS